MVNEAVVIETYGANGSGDKRRYTCASGVAISKGTILTLSDPRTAAASSGVGQVFAGIAAMDKESNDNSISISAWENLMVDLKASNVIAAGDKVRTAGPNNYVCSLGALSSKNIVVGVAQEAAIDEDVINVRVNN